MKSKVSVVRCDSYEPAKVKNGLKEAIELIGGMAAFVKDGYKVLLKPNLLSARLPEEAVDTHPEFVRQVALLVREASGIPTIGDSPSSYFTTKFIDDVYERSGMKSIANKEGIGLIRFNEIIHIKGYPIAKALNDYNLVINLPKLKTHTLTILTGAIKNTYGFVPGLSKVQYHKACPNVKEFSKVLADIFSITKPGLSIMDGITGMDGDGPAGGRVRRFGLILASADAVSLDAVFSYIAGLPYSKNRLLMEVTERNLGNGHMEDIEIKGADLKSIKIRDFKLPKTALPHIFPSLLTRLLARLLDFRPLIDESLCKKCNICRDTCPVSAITINKDISKIDKTKCIKCFCCHEVCPYDAIYVKKNIFSKMIWH